MRLIHFTFFEVSYIASKTNSLEQSTKIHHFQFALKYSYVVTTDVPDVCVLATDLVYVSGQIGVLCRCCPTGLSVVVAEIKKVRASGKIFSSTTGTCILDDLPPLSVLLHHNNVNKISMQYIIKYVAS